MWKVDLIERERGWGPRLVDTKPFKNFEAAEKYQETFNSANNEDTTPDWYMYATEPYKG